MGAQHSRRVLVADDDTRLLKALSVRLKNEGVETILCTDAYQALEKARRERPDLLVLDVRMPAGNGFSVKERLTRVPELAAVPAIFITGLDPKLTDQIAEEHHAYEVLHKPFSSDEFIATVLSALALTEQSEERYEIDGDAYGSIDIEDPWNKLAG